MDLQQFKTNWKTSGLVCPGTVERLKYIFWLYGQKISALRNFPLRIQFRLLEPVGNLRLFVRLNRGADPFIFGEVFVHRYYDLPLEGNPGTILDLGANIGFATLFLCRKYPNARIASVEPMGENLKVLEFNLRENRVDATVVRAAIAVEDGQVSMVHADQDYGHKVAGIDFGREMKGEQIEVVAISMPSLLGKLGWERVGLLKIDVEGYEGLLLGQNCEWLYRVDAICIECHEGFGLEDLKQVAKRYGFKAPVALPGLHLLTRPNPSSGTGS
jgi:FkbM family methyltransferase